MKKISLCVGYYLFAPDNTWIKEASRKETTNACNSIKDEIILATQTKGKRV